MMKLWIYENHKVWTAVLEFLRSSHIWFSYIHNFKIILSRVFFQAFFPQLHKLRSTTAMILLQIIEFTLSDGCINLEQFLWHTTLPNVHIVMFIRILLGLHWQGISIQERQQEWEQRRLTRSWTVHISQVCTRSVFHVKVNWSAL